MLFKAIGWDGLIIPRWTHNNFFLSLAEDKSIDDHRYWKPTSMYQWNRGSRPLSGTNIMYGSELDLHHIGKVVNSKDFLAVERGFASSPLGKQIWK